MKKNTILDIDGVVKSLFEEDEVKLSSSIKDPNFTPEPELKASDPIPEQPAPKVEPKSVPAQPAETQGKIDAPQDPNAPKTVETYVEVHKEKPTKSIEQQFTDLGNAVDFSAVGDGIKNFFSTIKYNLYGKTQEENQATINAAMDDVRKRRQLAQSQSQDGDDWMKNPYVVGGAAIGAGVPLALAAAYYYKKKKQQEEEQRNRGFGYY